VVDIVKDKLLIGGTAVTTTAAELNVLDAVTAGTVTASLGVVVDSNKDIGTFRNITLSGELDAGSLDVSGDADIDGTLEADAITVDGTTLAEYISDTVGAMVTSNTESGITVAYQDGDNTLDFTVGTLNQDTTGTAAIATTVTITDNESTNEENAVVFTAGGDVDGGNLGLESDGNLTYNPSSGTLTATAFAGALTGNVTGNASGTALTVTQAAQSAITSLGTLTALTVDDVAINAKTITMTGSTDDTVTFVAGTNGTLTITTTDTAAAGGDILIRADGPSELEGTTVTLDSSGDVVLSAAGGDVTIDDGTTTIFTFDAANVDFTMSDDADTGDYFKIATAANGYTKLTTVDDDGADADLIIFPDGITQIVSNTQTIEATLDSNLFVQDSGAESGNANDAITFTYYGSVAKPSTYMGQGNTTTAFIISNGSRLVGNQNSLEPDGTVAVFEAIATSSSIYRMRLGGHYWFGDTGLTAHDGSADTTYKPSLTMSLMSQNQGGHLGVAGGIIVGTADLGTQSAYDNSDTMNNRLIHNSTTGGGTTATYIGNQAITTSSDRRIKKDIVDTGVNAIEILDQLRVVDFVWDDPTDIGKNNRNMRGQWTGMIAQEVVDIVPYIINAPRTLDGVLDYDSENTWMVDYQHLVPMLVKAVQELNAEVQELKGGK
jgi:hypothetical protein